MNTTAEEIIGLLKTLEISVEGVAGSTRLREDLGMDSAEIIDLVCACEARFGVHIVDDGSLISTLKDVSDVCALVQRHRHGTPDEQRLFAMDDDAGFEGRTTEMIEIGAPVEAVYAALVDVAVWPRYLPHVRAIDLSYDDGQYQEFRMSVASEGEVTLQVRSVRNCRPGVIEFFQPEPPPYLRHHGGAWRFFATGPASCRVEVTHLWNHGARLAEFFTDRDDATAAEQVHVVLAAHSRLALERWKTVLESAQESTRAGRVEVA